MRHALSLLKSPFFARSPGTERRRRSSREFRVEGLEPRMMLTAAPLGVAVESATTTDSESVEFTYDVETPNLPSTLTFGIYRAATNAFDSTDTEVASISIPTSTLGTGITDTNGQPASATGTHTLKVAVPGGLTILPDQPYVLVVANPDTALAHPTPRPARPRSTRM